MIDRGGRLTYSCKNEIIFVFEMCETGSVCCKTHKVAYSLCPSRPHLRIPAANIRRLRAADVREGQERVEEAHDAAAHIRRGQRRHHHDSTAITLLIRFILLWNDGKASLLAGTGGLLRLYRRLVARALHFAKRYCRKGKS